MRCWKPKGATPQNGENGEKLTCEPLWGHQNNRGGMHDTTTAAGRSSMAIASPGSQTYRPAGGSGNIKPPGGVGATASEQGAGFQSVASTRTRRPPAPAADPFRGAWRDRRLKSGSDS